MRSFADYHPLPQFLYFLFVSLTITVFVHPYLVLSSWIGALLLWFVRNGRRNLRSHALLFLAFCGMVLINALFQHNGETILLVVNRNNITLEALLYGAVAAGMLVSVLYWCRSLSQMMTTDRLLYLTSRLSPRIALIVSMALRYIPLFGRQANKVQVTQRQLGAYRENSVIDKIQSALRTGSVMTTWALENGIITADSMAARGYGVARRTNYHLFRMRREDYLLLVTECLLFGMTVAAGCRGALRITWYPSISLPDHGPLAMTAYICYTILVCIPTVLEIGGNIRWKYLRSKI